MRQLGKRLKEKGLSIKPLCNEELAVSLADGPECEEKAMEQN
jgi:hypothetical protein